MCGYLRSRGTIGTTTGGRLSGRNRLTPCPDPGSMRTPRLDRLLRLTQGTAWRLKRYLSWMSQRNGNSACEGALVLLLPYCCQFPVIRAGST